MKYWALERDGVAARELLVVLLSERARVNERVEHMYLYGAAAETGVGAEEVGTRRLVARRSATRLLSDGGECA